MGGDLSIVIVTYNSWTLARRTLRSFESAILADPDHACEIIVVDNHSKGDLAALLAREFPTVRLIRNVANLGLSRANNIGLAASGGRYVLFANPDVVVEASTLPTLVALMDGDRSVGACTPFLELMDTGRLDPGAHRGFPTPWAALTHFLGLRRLCGRSCAMHRVFGRYLGGGADVSQPHAVDAVEGGFLFARREALTSVGGWDEDYFLFGEDLDLCCRLRQRGWRVMFYPQARATHYLGGTTGLKRHADGPADVDQIDRQRAYEAFYDAMRIFYDKHYRDRYGRLVRSLVFAAIEMKRRSGRKRLTV